MDSEKIIKLLAEFAIPEYYPALEILFANRDWLPRFPDENGKEQLVIIELNKKPDDRSIEAIQLARSKWKEKFLDPLNNAIQRVDKQELGTTFSSVFSNIANNPIQYSVGIMGKETIEGMASDLIHQCILKYNVQNDIFKNEKFLRQLSNQKLQLIEPLSQISVCGECHNFELILSSYPKKESKCSKCSRDVLIARVYKLDRNYETHKLENKDLPLFVSHYLSLKNPATKIHTSYKMEDDSKNSIKGDIDVYIPSTKTGFECKLFVDSQPQGNQFESKKGEIMESLLKYAKFGLERLIALTNLSQIEASNIETYVKTKLAEEGFTPKYLKIKYFSVNDLISTLNNEINHMNNLGPK